MASETIVTDNFDFDALLDRGHLLNDVLTGMPRVDERLHHVDELTAELRVARDRPRLDQRHTFPRLAPLGVIVLAAFQRTRQRPGRAFRAQTKIDPEDRPLLALRADGTDDFRSEE